MAVITPPLGGSLSGLYRSLNPGTNFLGGSASGAFTPITPYSAGAAPTFQQDGQANSGSGTVVPQPAAFNPGSNSFNISTSDYENDPIVGMVRGAVDAQTKQAEAQALAEKQTQLLRFGDPAMAQAILGGKASSADVYNNNPFSTTNDLNTWNNRSLTGIDETRNQQNLFYSTTRARDRSLQEESMLRAKSKASAQLQDVINQISQDVINVKNQGMQQIIAAEEGAYNRALQKALADAQLAAMSAASSGGGGGGGGGTVTVDPSTGAPVVGGGGGGGTSTYDFVVNRPPASVGGPGGIPE